VLAFKVRNEGASHAVLTMISLAAAIYMIKRQELKSRFIATGANASVSIQSFLPFRTSFFSFYVFASYAPCFAATITRSMAILTRAIFLILSFLFTTILTGFLSRIAGFTTRYAKIISSAFSVPISPIAHIRSIA